MHDIIKIVTEFGVALVGRQQQFFLDESIDNSEHVLAIKRIADTAYQYLKASGITSDICNRVRKELIARARDLFVEEWIRTLEEDEEPPDQEDRLEAGETFDELLKGE
ncbi:MAG: hypothetical protein A2V62_06680 [Nitrospirae bacterium RBG_19FT_COMBO_58_9]|nr:MAG: hypothetical protein A2V62_06680 [Nitrospirae bacterium RBG_19FT_COMBO_58_9]